MLNEDTNPKFSKKKKLSNNLIVEILQFLKPTRIGQCLLLDKTINSSLSHFFKTYNISVGNTNVIIINKRELIQDGETNNIRISVRIQEEFNKKNLLMLQLHKNEKERLGVIPLLYKYTEGSYITNINSNKYSSLFYMLKKGNLENMKFKVELITRFVPSITVREITFSIMYFNVGR
jgi:hypothetical protein